jgi:hypothetical protein
MGRGITSLALRFPGPPRAIILKSAKCGQTASDPLFCISSLLLEASFQRSSLYKKNASLLAMHFADFQVIRLGFEPKTELYVYQRVMY